MRDYTIGIAWYERAEYRTLAALMEDAESFPGSYDAWLQAARALRAGLERDDRRVVRVHLQASEFKSWCRDLGLVPGSTARQYYVHWFISGCRTVAGSRRALLEPPSLASYLGPWTWACSVPCDVNVQQDSCAARAAERATGSR